MRRGWITGAAVGVLALISVTLAYLALRPATEEPLTRAPFEMGAVAAAGNTVWRWVGPIDCTPDADVLPAERSESGGPWEPARIPLANVYGFSFADEERGIATGTTGQCSRGVALTENGGRTWKSSPDNPVLLDAWYEGNIVWGVERVIGQPLISAYKVDAKLMLRPIKGLDPIEPCTAADGVPDQIAFWNDEVGVVLCQNAVSTSRLLARTVNAGKSFERLTDDRPSFGLDGPGVIHDLDIAGTEDAWVLFEPGSECSEGQLRYSDSQGASFDRLPCPRESVRVAEVLDVAFSTPTDGVMLGLQARQPVMFVTDDGGRTWSERPEG